MSSAIGELAVVWTIVLVILLPIIAFYTIVMWKLLEKAGEPGWKAVIPVYGWYVFFKVIWGNGWYLLLYAIVSLGNSITRGIIDNDFSPSGWLILLWFLFLAGFITVRVFYSIKFAKAYGKDGGWACGIYFLEFIFAPIMAFSKDIVYTGVPGKTPPYGNGYGQQNFQQPNYQNPYPQGYQNPYIQQNNYQQTGYQVPNQQQSSQNPQYYYQQPTAQGATKYCSGCGSQVENGGMFCPKCGKPQ